jgi:GntR family transcriptional regulator
MLDKNSPIPLYYQIAERLKEQIAAGELTSGARLTSERELSEQLSVSRMTVRQAISYLQDNGLLEVRPGVGAFVAQPKHTYNALSLLGFSEEMNRGGDQVESMVLEQGLVQPPARVATHLLLDAQSLALKITRLRKVNGEPMLLETSYLSAARCPGLELADLSTHSLYALLETRYGLRLLHTRQSLEAVLANEYEQHIFALRAGVAMILVEGVTYGEQETPIESFKAVYRSDRCKFQLESWRNASHSESNASQYLSQHLSQRLSVVVT